MEELLTIPDNREEFYTYWVALADSLNTEIDMMAIRNTAEEWGEEQ